MAAVPTTGFQHAFDGLLAAFRGHQDVDRDPSNVQEIGAARAELDDARAAVKSSRATWVRRPVWPHPVVGR